MSSADAVKATRSPRRGEETNALREAGTIAGWTMLFWSGAQLAGAWLERSETMAVGVQAAIAEWCAGKVGIPWSDPNAPLPSARLVATRIGRGAVLGGGCGGLVVAVALAAHGATIARAQPAVGALVLGLLVAALSAVRDELFLRGAILRMARGLLPAWVALLACGAAEAAARFGTGDGGGLALLVDALRGIALGAVWTRDRGAWMACAANAAWAWTLGSVTRGAAFDIRFATEPEAGLPALAVTAAAALAAAVWALRRSGPRP